mmetsp:Transcript_87928/g.249084  ORF Transcript_87928/g.249084 Transcript_87928/m.249084 type:complete len:274 (+) Transcript_87928:73-894(+)
MDHGRLPLNAFPDADCQLDAEDSEGGIFQKAMKQRQVSAPEPQIRARLSSVSFAADVSDKPAELEEGRDAAGRGAGIGHSSLGAAGAGAPRHVVFPAVTHEETSESDSEVEEPEPQPWCRFVTGGSLGSHCGPEYPDDSHWPQPGATMPAPMLAPVMVQGAMPAMAPAPGLAHAAGAVIPIPSMAMLAPDPRLAYQPVAASVPSAPQPGQEPKPRRRGRGRGSLIDLAKKQQSSGVPQDQGTQRQLNFCPFCCGRASAHFRFCQFCGASLSFW